MSERVRIYTYLLHPLMCVGLQTLIKSHADYEFIESFATLDHALDTLGRPSSGRKDLLVTDFVDDFDTHPHLLSGLRAQNPQLGVLFFLSMPTSESTLVKSLRVGGDGYLLQSADTALMVSALDCVANDKGFLEPGLTPTVLSELRKPMFEMSDVDIDVELSQRERLLLQLAADGLNNVKIAQVLGINEKTVRHHWSMLFRKIGLTDRTQTVLWGIRTGKAELRNFDTFYED